ncbi:MAG: rRNA maturation RNase YbeY [Candidatus Moranbacteria bacterium]|nr:rRNA maturation RNase YbeY [Candidatus Moranbacteria bacterium]
MHNIDIIDKTKGYKAEKFIKESLKKGIEFLLKEEKSREDLSFSLSVALVGKDEIARLNESYRKKSGPTDVLSFCYNKDKRSVEGEVVLAPEAIKENACNSGKSFEAELEEVLIHSLLHVYGFNHGKKMFGLQKKFLE